MIVHVECHVHYLLLCAFLQNDVQLKSMLKIQTVTHAMWDFLTNSSTSYIGSTIVEFADDNIHCNYPVHNMCSKVACLVMSFTVIKTQL